MGSTQDKLKGHANEAVGKIKRGVGEATDDPSLKDEGRAQELKGDWQKAAGEAKDAVKSRIDKA